MDDMIHEGQTVDICSFSEQLEAIEAGMRGDAHSLTTVASSPRAVLVHCDMGVNRSPTLVLAFLMRSGMSLRSAYRLVFGARECVDPLPGYRQALMAYEMKLHGKCTVAKDEHFALHLSELMAMIAVPEREDSGEGDTFCAQVSEAPSLASDATSNNDQACSDPQLDAAFSMRRSSISRLLSEEVITEEV
jgi:hypothetical protein